MSKYQPLHDHLRSLRTKHWRASFAEIEEVIGKPLPASARKFPAWWANDNSQGRQSHAWLNSGFATSDLSLTKEEISFERRTARKQTPVHTRSQPPRSKKGHPTDKSASVSSTFEAFEVLLSPDRPVVALVSCVKRKQSKTSPAKDLYVSPLFQMSRKLAEEKSERWFILSALHGLVDPDQTISPYEKTLNNASRKEREVWAQSVFDNLRKKVPSEAQILLFAGSKYTELLIPLLKRRGHQIIDPLHGLTLGRRLSWLSQTSSAPGRDVNNQILSGAGLRFYELIDKLLSGLDGGRILGNCNGRQSWPQRGVYLLFEPSELRAPPYTGQRVIRVGTHAVSSGSKAKLWNRLSNHKGTTAGHGNQRGSVFRHHVGNALIARSPDKFPVSTWNQKNRPPPSERDNEVLLEHAVSNYIGRMTLAWISIPDNPSRKSDRAYIERNAIGLLSGNAYQPPSPSWLGQNSDREAIRASALWNVDYVGQPVDSDFPDRFEHYVLATIKSFHS